MENKLTIVGELIKNKYFKKVSPRGKAFYSEGSASVGQNKYFTGTPRHPDRKRNC